MGSLAKMAKPILSLLAVFVLSATSLVANASPVAPENYIVAFKNDTNVKTELKWWKSKSFSIRNDFQTVFKGMAVRVDANQVKQLIQDKDVLFVEKDSIVSVDSGTQANPSWGLDRIDQIDTPLNQQYKYISTGNNVKIYIVDTGVLDSHNEFTGRMLPGFTSIYDGFGTSDCDGHGTHVAGIAAGTSFGVAKGASIVPVRVLNCRGSGTYSSVLDGLEWTATQIIEDRVSGLSSVINMSISGPRNDVVNLATQNLINLGATVVVASGNEKTDACSFTPSSVAAAITVSATTSADSFATYSNRGACVDLLAPGNLIQSAYIGSNTSSATLSGTSMASPHVAGAAALILESGWKSPAAVSNQLLSRAAVNTITGVPPRTANRFLQTEAVYAPILTASSGQINGNARSPISPLNFSVTNLSNPVFSISPDIQSETGLFFSTTTGQISGTPSTEISNRIYSITATGSFSSATTTITVNIGPALPPALTPSSYTFSGRVNTFMRTTSLAPTGNFEGAVSFELASDSPALPLGLSVDPSTGQIFGTPTAVLPVTNIKIKASGAIDGEALATVALSVTAQPVNAAPDSPSNVVARELGSRIVNVSWTPGAVNGAAVSQQKIFVYEIVGGTPVSRGSSTVSRFSNSVTLRLTAGKTYEFKVSTTNRFGTSQLSLPSNQVTVR